MFICLGQVAYTWFRVQRQANVAWRLGGLEVLQKTIKTTASVISALYTVIYQSLSKCIHYASGKQTHTEFIVPVEGTERKICVVIQG